MTAPSTLPVPILMYHEISTDPQRPDGPHHLTPLYDLPAAQLEDQLRRLSDGGYQSLSFEETVSPDPAGPCVILTFDDGLKGNHRYALPLLKRYGLKAVFFINVGSIGTEPFMTWSDLADLVSEGMSVQSHALSHRPLQPLPERDIRRELTESKRLLEERLRIAVTAISFPHGSYDGTVLRLAREAGYRYCCCSEISPTYLSSFRGEDRALGRFAVTTRLSAERFLKMIAYTRGELIRLTVEKRAKNLLKRVIGIENYRSLYRRYFNIAKPTEGD